jgi:hypothetical protein
MDTDHETKRLSVAPDSDLALLIERAASAGGALVVYSGNAVYQLRAVRESPEAQPAADPSGSATDRRVRTPREFYDEVTSRPDTSELLRRLATPSRSPR